MECQTTVNPKMSNSSSSWAQGIKDQEIEWACTVMGLPLNAFHGPNKDDLRLKAIRSLESLDIEACPGSGKTTLLVAKLAILANRWKSRKQGICVLSHTNAARFEIGDRLSSTNTGSHLLQHPHFVGTIHSFVNEFLAIPWLRSKGWPLKVIDTQIALKDRWYRLPVGTQKYLERQHLNSSALSYTNSDFTGGAKSKFSAHTSTYKKMLEACRESTADGYYCFDEMFVWAAELLEYFPETIKAIRNRFPLIFIDEVQDNSELQSAFLHHLFINGKNPVIRQRFGDSNQAIYHRSGASGAVTDRFPGVNKVDLPNSFRFGPTIAELVAPLGVRPQALVGLGPSTSRIKYTNKCKNALILFDDISVLEVLPAYAKHLLETFPPEILTQGDFTAVAGVHRSDKNDNLPRFMGHYAPNYNPDISGQQPKPLSFIQHLNLARLELANSRNTSAIVNSCANGILHFVKEAGLDLTSAHQKRPNRLLMENLPNTKSRKEYAALIKNLINSRCCISKKNWNEEIAPAVITITQAILGRKIEEPIILDFLSWTDPLHPENAPSTSNTNTNNFFYPQEEPKVSIRLGSIHSVKGETHTATLILESFQKTHHLKKLIPWLIGKRPTKNSDNIDENDSLKERLKLHYVAMTRPSHLLCLAMRKDSFKTSELELMQKRNWEIIDITPP